MSMVVSMSDFIMRHPLVLMRLVPALSWKFSRGDPWTVLRVLGISLHEHVKLRGTELEGQRSESVFSQLN